MNFLLIDNINLQVYCQGESIGP